MKMGLGAVLHACRERAGYSQEKLAELLNLSRSCISKYEKNHKPVHAETLFRWADVTNAREVVVAYLYGLDGLSMIQSVLQVTGMGG
ncbi:helix-turn-helix transcriptional regulator [Paenibacillus sp. PL2-23]|uniref:helix-turn-helix domain-containing protein n=1 Tax=Paenibacillus sp. PL2-23 TaxID=2100729 RepID=UPI0030F6D771